MIEEFGEEIAVAVSNGQQLSPPLKCHLLQAASAARERRTEFLEVLEQGEKALDSARTTLTELEDQSTAPLTQPLSNLSIDELLTTL